MFVWVNPTFCHRNTNIFQIYCQYSRISTKSIGKKSSYLRARGQNTIVASPRFDWVTQHSPFWYQKTHISNRLPLTNQLVLSQFTFAREAKSVQSSRPSRLDWVTQHLPFCHQNKNITNVFSIFQNNRISISNKSIYLRARGQKCTVLASSRSDGVTQPPHNSAAQT